MSSYFSGLGEWGKGGRWSWGREPQHVRSQPSHTQRLRGIGGLVETGQNGVGVCYDTPRIRSFWEVWYLQCGEWRYFLVCPHGTRPFTGGQALGTSGELDHRSETRLSQRRTAAQGNQGIHNSVDRDQDYTSKITTRASLLPCLPAECTNTSWKGWAEHQGWCQSIHGNW